MLARAFGMLVAIFMMLVMSVLASAFVMMSVLASAFMMVSVVASAFVMVSVVARVRVASGNAFFFRAGLAALFQLYRGVANAAFVQGVFYGSLYRCIVSGGGNV